MVFQGDGYTVAILEGGRAGGTYREGTRTMVLNGELLDGKAYDFVVVARTMKWEGFEEPITDAERERVCANIVAVGLKHGVRFMIER